MSNKEINKELKQAKQEQKEIQEEMKESNSWNLLGRGINYFKNKPSKEQLETVQSKIKILLNNRSLLDDLKYNSKV